MIAEDLPEGGKSAAGRLLIVSSHFPPNFVSGGTLVPYRQAKGLSKRGWDVSVFAGHVDDGTAPLVEHETVDDGIRVHWVDVSPFTSWADRRNYDNPQVERRFASLLERVSPDVVHFHSLQTLGAGLLGQAAATGARVVVTMHDFWWCCARQFLVDRSWTPCSLVVAAGSCQCEVDSGWLTERNSWLKNQLSNVDLVLAPSRIAADVLMANGVPEDRLHVDENGLRAPGLRVARPEPSGPVRFRYTGGAERMKGVEVLRQATLHLASSRDDDSWSVVAHGQIRDLQRLGPWPRQVHLAQPFSHDELDTVMAHTDLVVVPSLMRESHSLVTREALSRGVPVVCTDCLGPEEVVVHGENGLVVPAGDASLLASALTSIVEDRELIRTWSEHAERTWVRSEDQRHDDLSKVLQAKSTRPPDGEREIAGPVLFVCGIDGAPLRYRAQIPAEALALVGVESAVVHYRDPATLDLSGSAEAIVLYRVPATEQVLGLIEQVRARHPEVPILFDVDDLIFDPDLADEIPALRILPAAEADLWLQGVRRYRTTMEHCDAYVGSTGLLVRHAEAVTGLPAFRFDNGVGAVIGQISDAELRRPRRSGRLRVGYLSGTTTHDEDWLHVEEAVVRTIEQRDDTELVLGGHLNPSPAVERLGDRLTRLPMMDWRDLPGTLRDLDVNLAPLGPGSRFNEAKSAIKWLEAALVGTPTIASPTEPFREMIIDGQSGFLADGPGDWQAALTVLLDDEMLRSRVGSRARREALLRLSPHRQGQRYLQILREAARLRERGAVDRVSDYTAVVLDEPWIATPLSSYEHRPGRGRLGSSPVERLRRAASVRVLTARAIGRSEGWPAVVKRGARAAGRDLARLGHRLARRAR